MQDVIVSDFNPDTKYNPSHCITVTQMGQDGKSDTQMAAAIGVPKRVMYGWAKSGKHPEFKYALELALTYAQSVWEDVGQKGSKGMLKDFSAPAWTFNMKNRYRSDYKDTIDTNVTSVAKEMTDAELDEAIALAVAVKASTVPSSGTPAQETV